MTDKVGISVNTLRQIVQGRPCVEQTRHISSDELITYTVNRAEANAISDALRIAGSVVRCMWNDAQLKKELLSIQSMTDEELDKLIEQARNDTKNVIDEPDEPVRHGFWLIYPDVCVCSECNEQAPSIFKYCPNCGATMDKESKEGWE